VSHAGLEPGSATHLLEGAQEVRTNHELIEHNDAKTDMIYTHVLKCGIVGIKSPADIVFS
jgi:site-specific recombinase XerD